MKEELGTVVIKADEIHQKWFRDRPQKISAPEARACHVSKMGLYMLQGLKNETLILGCLSIQIDERLKKIRND